MTHSYAHYFALLAVALCCGSTAWCDDPPKADAAPDPCVTDFTVEKLDNPPERKTKFEVKEPRTMELFNVKVVDQKYVARIRILLPYRSGDPYRGQIENRGFGRESAFLRPGYPPEELTALQVVYATPLMSRGRNDIPRSFSEEAPAQSWQRMLAQIPAERQPAEKLQRFFTEAQVQEFVFVDKPGIEINDDNTAAYRSFSILGTTPDETEQRAKALLTIFDQGFSRPLQKGLLKMRGELCDQLHDSEVKLAAAQKEYQTVAEEFKQYQEFPDETLTGLRIQLFQWESQLAALRAKIDACDKLLKGDTTADRRKQIEEAKTAAEIELAGCEGGRAKSAEFIAKVKQRSEVARKRDLAASESDKARILHGNLVGAVKRIDEEIDMFGPVRLVDDTVLIQPVEWTKASEFGRSFKAR